MKRNMLNGLRNAGFLAIIVLTLGWAKPAMAQDGIYLPNDLYWIGRGILTENSSDVNIALSDDIYYMGMSILESDVYNIGNIEDQDLKNVAFAIYKKDHADADPDDDSGFDPNEDYIAKIENTDWKNFALGVVNGDESAINNIGNDDIYYLASALAFDDIEKLESIWHYDKDDLFHLGLAILQSQEAENLPFGAPFIDSIKNADLRALASAYGNGEGELDNIKNVSFAAVAKAIFGKNTEELINSEDIDWNRATRAIVDGDQDAQYEIFNSSLSTFAQAIMDNSFEKLNEIRYAPEYVEEPSVDEPTGNTDDGYKGNDLYFLARGLMTKDVAYVEDIDNNDLKLVLQGVIEKNAKLFKDIQEYDLKYVGMALLKNTGKYAKKISSPDWRLFVGHTVGKLDADSLPETNDDRYFRSDDIFYLTVGIATQNEDVINSISY